MDSKSGEPAMAAAEKKEDPVQPERDRAGAMAAPVAKKEDPVQSVEDTWEYNLREYLLLLASVVATVTYGVGFSPPGGVWEESDKKLGRLAGDPIIRITNFKRYSAFFYFNATAFALSLVVIVLILLLAVRHDKKKVGAVGAAVVALRIAMVLDLLSLMGAFAAGTCRDKFTTIYSSLLVTAVFVYLVVQMVMASWTAPSPNGSVVDLEEQRRREVSMLLATFAVSVTYVAGLTTPGGFWGSGDLAGTAILKNRQDARLTAFFVCNTTAFAASLLIIVLLLDGKFRARSEKVMRSNGCIILALAGLIGAYAAGGCRKADTTIYVLALVAAVLTFIIVFHFLLVKLCSPASPAPAAKDDGKEKARSLILLLATLAVTITYQAGLDPPGGLWSDDGGDLYKIGDPILLTKNPRRFKVFFYCNSVAFVASLVIAVLVQLDDIHQVLVAAMVLDLFGLIGAYAAGSCRDVSTSVYAMALAGAVLVYVVIHVVFFTLDSVANEDAMAELPPPEEEEEKKKKKDKEKKEEMVLVEKRRQRLLLFAILAATITYQSGLTPPGGFITSGERAGDSVLLGNFARRYNAFFYCNSLSFMLSVAVIVLLVNRNLYIPAIRSWALSVCTAAGLFGLMGAYAAGSTQYMKTSMYIFALVALVVFSVLLLLLIFLLKEVDKVPPPTTPPSPPAPAPNNQIVSTEQQEEEKTKKEAEHGKRMYMMLLGILVASVTYQAGLRPPGGFWQSDDDGGHRAGNPVMHDNRRARYLVFFYSNSTSLEASIVVIILLLLQTRLTSERQRRVSLMVMNTALVLDLVGLLVAYAAGSSRHWQTSLYVVALIVAVLAYFVIHAGLYLFSKRKTASRLAAVGSQP